MKAFAMFGVALALLVVAGRACQSISDSDCVGEVYMACRTEPSVSMSACAGIAREYCEVVR